MESVQGERGFTMIELMIVVAIIGILAAVAIPSFMSNVRAAKLSEAPLAIDKVTKTLRTYYPDHLDMPPSSSGYVPAVGCSGANGKVAAAPGAAWDADPAFSALEFRISEPGYFQYTWLRTSQTTGTLIARFNLDCNTTFGSFVASYTIVDGSAVRVTVAKFPE